MATAQAKGGGLGDLLAGLFNPRSGRLDPAAIFSGDIRDENREYRRAVNTLAEQEAKAKQFDMVKGVADLFQGSPTDTQQAGLRQTLEGQGFDSAMLAPLARGATESRKKGRQAGVAAGLAPEVARIADIDSAQAAGQTAFSAQKQQETNTQQAGLSRETDRLQAGLTRESDRLRQERALTNQTEGARYGAILDVWKNEQTKGTRPDPYPVLEGLYHAGAFKSSPQAEQIVGYHIANRTDPESASKMLADLQAAATKPPGGGSVSERRDARSLKGLKLNLRGGNIPPEQKREARFALRAKDADTARGLLKQRIAATKPPTGDDWLPSAQALVADAPRFAKLPADQQAIVQAAVQSGDKTTLKVVMPSLIKGDFEGAAKVFSNPMFRGMVTQAQDLVAAKGKVAAALDSAAVPGVPGSVDDSLFGPWMSMMDPALILRLPNYPEPWKQRKQALITNATDSLSSWLLSRSGKAASDKERQMYANAWINGNEPSSAIYIAKNNAVQAALDRELALREQEARMIAAGISSGSVEEGLDAIFGSTMESAYRQNAEQLAAELDAIQNNPDLMPDVPLTAEQRAAMGGQ